MSSTQPQVASSTTASPSTSTSPPASPLSDTSTLLFGFLVSALSIFAIFMMSAIIWNRLVARRHAIDAMLAINPPRNTQRVQRPTMWDVWAMPDKQLPSLRGLKPVAVQKCDCPASSARTRQNEHTISFWRHQILNRLPPEITYLFHRPIPRASNVSRDTNMSPVELSEGSNVQISLLVSMPHAEQSAPAASRERCQRLHEVVFATTNLIYHESDPS